MVNEKHDPKKYAMYRGERQRFMRLLTIMSSNQHKSGLEKTARLLAFGSMSLFNSSENKPRKAEDVFPDLDVD